MNPTEAMFRLDGSVAVVTGAGSGIGQAVAWGLAEMGAKVGCIDLQEGGLLETAQGIRDRGGISAVATCDVREEARMQETVRALEGELQGRVSLALNAAGIGRGCPAEEMPLSEWNEMLAIDLTGVFVSCRAEVVSMFELGRGAIVNVASMSGTIANRGLTQAHYNAAKAGVVHLTRSLAMEWCQRGVRVNSLSPGYTATPMNLRPDVAEQVKQFESATPMGRIAKPEEMVGPCIFLLSNAASYCTGVDLLVDGGFTCW